MRRLLLVVGAIVCVDTKLYSPLSPTGSGPVRPNRKHLYPFTPIERYAAWTRTDGFPFDPWLRAHVRLGGTALRCEPRSMEITAPIGDWETWTSMTFPEDGDYIFPEGLAPLRVNDGTGVYWEPNVWVLHET